MQIFWNWAQRRSLSRKNGLMSSEKNKKFTAGKREVGSRLGARKRLKQNQEARQSGRGEAIENKGKTCPRRTL